MKKIFAGLFLLLFLFQMAAFAETPVPVPVNPGFTTPKPASQSVFVKAGKGTMDLIGRGFRAVYDITFTALRRMDLA